MDKLKIKALEKGKSWKQLVIDSETHKALTQLSKTTGISMSRLVAKMTIFCADRIEIEE
jgi:hypothetical protein